MIRVKRAYEPADRGDGKRFLVDGVWPRGVKRDQLQIEDWIRDVAPSTELRKWFGHDPDRWSEFQRRYRQELASHQDALAPLLDAARRGNVTLVYGARDIQHNQAVVLKQVLEEHLGHAGTEGADSLV
jgi:uncharacterized protein YeaO (DUF488 family)